MGLADLLTRDDWIYTGILGSSFAISWLLRSSQNMGLIRHGGGLIGFMMALLILRWKIFYSIPLVVFTMLSIKLVDQRLLTKIVFVVTFVYLLVCRYLHFVFPIEELASQANGLQLIMTLRVIGLSFEISDSRVARSKPKSDDTKVKRHLLHDPSLSEMFNYFYHYCGLFTGPYYTFQMLLDSQEPVLITSWSPLNEIKQRGLQLLWSVPLFVITNKLFPLDHLRSDAIWEWSFTYRLFWAAAVFVVFRNRVYSAWAVSESICVTIGIGIYPKLSKPTIVVGPTDVEKYQSLHGRTETEYSSEAITNLDIGEVEFSDGFRSGIRAWNRSVQSWLALFVYSRTSRTYRVEVTMFVSALWHGTYAGYFMSFLVVPMCTAVEDVIFKQFANAKPKWFQWLYILTLRSRGFDFLATGFLLKNFADTHRFWSSLYYWLPISLAPIYVISKVIMIIFPPPKRVVS
ncbi:unnamed protein product, partial [Mesorhabditis belari]|uniref:Lysophospholipid acyltransferase 7 n=1 Tax=Mesorhabditis belari TaxID=2138241 RepID=A0AAF3E9X5_9BILA